MAGESVYLALGTNLGDRQRNVETALALLDAAFGRPRDALSSIIETEACGFSGPAFLNCVVRYDSVDMPCESLLALCKDVERRMGRTDREEYDSQGRRIYHDRIIDVDIVLYGSRTSSTPTLTIPHPALRTRAFLAPLLNEVKVDMNTRILVTGAAGFIGANLVMRLLRTWLGAEITGLDSLNDYYDVRIKEYRLAQIEREASEAPLCRWKFVKGNIADSALVQKLFAENAFDIVVNLAAQAGVRYSITNPDAYIESNVIGFYNILEACRHSKDGGAAGVKHLVYASSSSVYGNNTKIPYSTDDKVDNPVSLYAATKKSNELFAHAYSKLYGIPSTGLRFFTVYGPAGRPDMAYFGFTDKLLAGETIKIFNYGNCKRDFTYVDDIVEGVVRIMRRPPELVTGPDGLPEPPYKVYNIGNSHPENLLDFVDILQQELVRAGVLPDDFDFEAHKALVPMQAGDVAITYADTTALERDFGFKPSTSLREGLRRFAEWYREFYCQSVTGK